MIFTARRGWAASAQIPRIYHRGAGVVENADVARDDDQVMDDCGRGDQAIGVTARPQCRNSSPFEGDLIGHAKNTISVVVAELLQPFRQMRGGAGIGSLFQGDAAHDFAQRNDAEMDREGIDRAQPANRFRRTASRFGDNVCVDEIHQKSMVRPGVFSR